MLVDQLIRERPLAHEADYLRYGAIVRRNGMLLTDMPVGAFRRLCFLRWLVERGVAGG